jgi:hypothetical protein
MAIVPVGLTDPWAVRELTICIRSFDELPPYARELVEHLRSSGSSEAPRGADSGVSAA